MSLEQLSLEIFSQTEDHVVDGLLSSASGNVYPIIGGVPRMLPPRLRQHLLSDYPDFFRKYSAQIAKLGDSSESAVQRHTQEAFGYEWTWAADYDANNFADWLPEGFTAEALFRGHIGLEVGCGAGRHAERNSTYAAEHFAVDLSRAVDSAFARNQSNPKCHVVQADAFHLPFAPGTFDYVYSLGVLQHMHDPPAGFRALTKLPKKGGRLLINVYQKGRPLTVGALELFRKISTRLSNENLRRLSELLGHLVYGIFIWPWKILKQTPLASVLRPVVPTRIDEYAKHSLRTVVVDWFDRLSCPVKIHYRKEDLQLWYRECGYSEVLVTPYWKAFWNGIGTRGESK